MERSAKILSNIPLKRICFNYKQKGKYQGVSGLGWVAEMKLGQKEGSELNCLDQQRPLIAGVKEMEAACFSETSATQPSSTRLQHPEARSTLVIECGCVR
jgi:hypothetical protein